VNSLLKTVTQQRRGCDLNPGPSAPESSTLNTRLPSHPHHRSKQKIAIFNTSGRKDADGCMRAISRKMQSFATLVSGGEKRWTDPFAKDLLK